MQPSSYYIKYLICRSWGGDPNAAETDNTVNTTLRTLGVPCITAEEFSLLQLSLEPPRDFAFSNRRHKATRAFMKEAGLLTLWDPGKDNARVVSFLLMQQRARMKIDILLMGQVPSALIADRINSEFRYRDGISKEMVDTYHHFFWNTDLPTPQEWHAILSTHPHKDALLAAYYCGPDQALYRVGGNPKIGDPKKPLREVQRQAYWVLMSLRYKPDSAENISLRSRLGMDLRAMHDAIFGEGADAGEQLKKFRNFLVKKHPKVVKSFDEIVGPTGSHSNDGSSKKSDNDDQNGDQDGGDE